MDHENRVGIVEQVTRGKRLVVIVGQRKAMTIAAESNPAGDGAKRRERSQASGCMCRPR